MAVLVLASALVRDQVGRSPCDVAFNEAAWDRVATACRDAEWGHLADLGRAWQLYTEGREDHALALAEQLLDTNVAADAAYLAGQVRSRREGRAEEDLTRLRFRQALAAYQREGRHSDASRAAECLSRVPRPEARFDDQLELAQLAVEEAARSDDARVLGRALGVLAEAYDWIGMEDDADDNFLRAEGLSTRFAEQMAHLHFKHGGFLLDLGTPTQLERSLRYLDSATVQTDRAIAKGLGKAVAELPLAISLNRADALSQLGRLDEADRELARAERLMGPEPHDVERARLRLVQGYVAARRGDVTRAETLFGEADPGVLDSDYRVRIALERGRMYRGVAAVQSYRDAIEVIEDVRGTATEVELRPWVLARRTAPYVELLALLVEQARGVDALEVAESLHARAWLDVVLDQRASDRRGAAQAQTAARIRQRAEVASAPPLDGEALMAAIGDREALVFLAIGAETWRGHIVDHGVRFERLAQGAVEVAKQFRSHPGDPATADLASRVLLPADLAPVPAPLYIIASGALADVPFAALRFRGRYLIEGRSVARLPGLAALRCDPASKDDGVVLLGDSRGDLAHAAKEVERIAVLLHGAAHVGEAASRAALAQARGARLLHIAGHGKRTPSGHAMLLSDGELTAAEVLDSGLAPQTVFLAGCETAASKDAESWNGFPSAFLAAGSRHVVATLTSVKDAEAARMSYAYYGESASMNPIERLAAAQRALIDVLPVIAWSSFTAWGSDACDARALPIAHSP